MIYYRSEQVRRGSTPSCTTLNPQRQLVETLGKMRVFTACSGEGCPVTAEDRSSFRATTWYHGALLFFLSSSGSSAPSGSYIASTLKPASCIWRSVPSGDVNMVTREKLCTARLPIDASAPSLPVPDQRSRLKPLNSSLAVARSSLSGRSPAPWNTSQFGQRGSHSLPLRLSAENTKYPPGRSTRCTSRMTAR